MISVVVPVRNSEKTIADLLEALKRQTRKDFEVILVDDGSTDGTVKVAEESGKGLNLRIVRQKPRGPAAARNLGAEKARGEIIVFTDSDCVPDERWLEEMVKPFEDESIVGVQGTYRTLNRDSLIARLEGYEIERRHRRMERKKFTDFVATFSAAYRKEVFKKFGGFDESYPAASGEDPDLSYRIAKAGGKMVFNPRAFVYHRHPGTLGEFARQKFYRGYWRSLLHRKYPEKMAGDAYTPADVQLSVATVSLLYASLILAPLLAPVFLLLFLVSNLGAIRFYASRERKMLLAAPPLLFLRTSLWIFGFVAGTVKEVLLRPRTGTSSKRGRPNRGGRRARRTEASKGERRR